MTVEADGSSGTRPVALIILDGWGSAPPSPGNAISLARTPVVDELAATCPRVLLEASGEAVGLPPGIMGNSEVGHLTLGAGRVIYQDLTRINRAIEDGSFFTNPVLAAAMDRAATVGGAVHLMGLLSDGGVHSAVEHIHALVELAKDKGVERLFVHCFMDGRDTSPSAGRGFLQDLESFLRQTGLGRIATLSGRYYAMDRDLRWERVERAYQALVGGVGPTAATTAEAIDSSYAQGITDEFVVPTVIQEEGSRISDGDTVIFFNFRPDRARELTRAFIEEDFDGFDRPGGPPQVQFIGMTEYDQTFDVPVAFPDEPPKNTLAEVLSFSGLSQLHIAETEKYAHVTFFFNGGVEEPYGGEIRRLIPSPKDVDTYDQKPEMSARQVADTFCEVFAERPLDFVILNFANPDMVGHTGSLSATVAALECVDACLGDVLAALREREARAFVTADHGNAETMLEADGSANTAHTTNPVPLYFVGEGTTLREGAGLSDVAPTILCLLGLEVPAEMTGRSLCDQPAPGSRPSAGEAAVRSP